MLVVVAAIVAVPVALLAIPVEVSFRLERVDVFRGRVTLRWLFGLVRLRAAVPRRGPPRRAASSGGERRSRARRGRGAGGSRGRVLAVLRQGAFRRRVQRLVADLARALRPSRVRLALRLGLADPADTGRLWALLGPLAAVLGGLRGAEVRLEPEFLEEALELRARGRVRLVPLRLVGLAACFALSPPALRAWWTLAGGRA